MIVVVSVKTCCVSVAVPGDSAGVVEAGSADPR